MSALIKSVSRDILYADMDSIELTRSELLNTKNEIMMKNYSKGTLTAIIAILMINAGFSQEPEPVFQKGRQAPAQFFTGNAYVTGLIDNDSVFTTSGGEVFFEAGARSNWHLHPSGQILIVTAGVGYHQLIGQPIEIIRKGDVVKCPPDILHWHGASKYSAMSHIYILPNTEKGMVEWKQAVTDEEYNNL